MNKVASENTSVYENTILPLNNKEESKSAASASCYALQVALQTMKERCQQLQLRLSAVEDENVKLQIEKRRISINTNTTDSSQGEINSLHELVAQLTGQKSQLTHHIFMVATENKQLWTRLSRLTEAKYSLGSQLNKFTDCSNKHSLGDSSRPDRSLHMISSDKPSDAVEPPYESLEEISLKIISSIIREKAELEQQCDQMSAIQSGTLSVQDYEFTLGADSGEQEEIAHDLHKMSDNLIEQKEILKSQQARLRSTLLTLTSLIKNGIPCKTCSKSVDKLCNASDPKTNEVKNDSSLNAINGIRHTPSNDLEDNTLCQDVEFGCFEDRICPICSQFFTRAAKFDEFHCHVLTHFSEDDVSY